MRADPDSCTRNGGGSSGSGAGADADGDGAVGAVDGYKFVPAVAAHGALTVLVCPFQVAYKPQRDKFLA